MFLENYQFLVRIHYAARSLILHYSYDAVLVPIKTTEVLRLDFTDLTGALSEEVCAQQGSKFGEIDTLTLDCNKISRPDDTCGECNGEFSQ